MYRKIVFISIVLLVSILASSGCLPFNRGIVSGDQAATQNAIIIQAVQSTATTMAMQTQIAQLQTQLAQGGAQPVAPTDTQQATAVEAVEATKTAPPPPTATLTATPAPPTNTPVPPTNTPIPPSLTPTMTPIPCNSAHFESDVSIPDGTSFAPGTTFTKTWRLRNDGACTWTASGYDIVFVGGTQFGSTTVVDLPGNVSPGQVIDVSVTMTAPASAGKYRSNWKLRDAAGVLFGVGHTGVSFYADINVSAPQSGVPYSFIANMCQASWTSGAGSLPCPGADNDARGFVMRVDNPILETGYVDDEPVLVMYPQMINDGVIHGTYPAFHVESGYHFLTTVGCAYKATNCYVTFRLDYQIGNGAIATLGAWNEKYDNAFYQVDVDLSSLAGSDVKFILTVLSDGSSSQDRAQWLLPRIEKK